MRADMAAQWDEDRNAGYRSAQRKRADRPARDEVRIPLIWSFLASLLLWAILIGIVYLIWW